MTSHQGSSVQHRKYSADKVRDLEDSRFPDVQARRKGTRVSRFRSHTREFWAEFFGTAVLVLFGTAVNHQVTLSGSTDIAPGERGSWTTISLGWGVAVMLGVVVSGGISGGHLNPAVTLTLAIFRGFSWAMVPLYWLAQFTGAFFGAGLTYLNYSRAISLFEGGAHIRTIGKTGGLYFTNPLPYMSNLGCFFNEFLMSAILMMFIVATGDAGNMAPPKGMSPFVILWVVFALASTFGMQTSFALNPARDIGPRLVTWAAGYGSEVWRIRSGYWFWCATLAPVCGTFVGCFTYDCCIGTDGVESALHNPDAFEFIRRLRGLRPVQETHTSRSDNIKTTNGSD